MNIRKIKRRVSRRRPTAWAVDFEASLPEVAVRFMPTHYAVTPLPKRKKT